MQVHKLASKLQKLVYLVTCKCHIRPAYRKTEKVGGGFHLFANNSPNTLLVSAIRWWSFRTAAYGSHRRSRAILQERSQTQINKSLKQKLGRLKIKPQRLSLNKTTET